MKSNDSAKKSAFCGRDKTMHLYMPNFHGADAGPLNEKVTCPYNPNIGIDLAATLKYDEFAKNERISNKTKEATGFLANNMRRQYLHTKKRAKFLNLLVESQSIIEAALFARP